jgi:hypothetical protein
VGYGCRQHTLLDQPKFVTLIINAICNQAKPEVSRIAFSLFDAQRDFVQIFKHAVDDRLELDVMPD